jgi:hypothetical protein
MRGSALIGNIAGVLALLDAGVPATAATWRALISVQPEACGGPALV